MRDPRVDPREGDVLTLRDGRDVLVDVVILGGVILRVEGGIEDMSLQDWQARSRGAVIAFSPEDGWRDPP